MTLGNKIHHKLLAVIIAPVVLLFAAFLVFLNVMMAPYLEGLILNKIETVGQQRMFQLENIYGQIYQSTQGILSDSAVQATLLSGRMNSQQEMGIKALLRTYCYDNVYNITYLTADCRQMVSGLSNAFLTRGDFEELARYPQLNESYAKSVWIYREQNDPSCCLFAVQRLRHPSFDAEPGYLVYQLDPDCMDQVMEVTMHSEESVAVLDQKGRVIASGKRKLAVQQALSQLNYPAESGAEELVSHSGDRYLVSGFVNENMGWRVVSYIAYEDAMEQYLSLQRLMTGITVLVVVVSVGVGMALTRFYLKPIGSIVRAMESFRHNRFQKRIQGKLPDEFGEIGDTFNLMADRIEALIQDVNQGQEKLRTAELNSLMYQINPHFIYNTLNNIYMLARMSGQPQTAQLIDCLSKFLRSTLSKGSSVVPLKDEISHVSSYLDIQKIRYGKLFDFSVEMDPNLSLTPVLKLILQPIVENSINHGFLEMESGGWIQIRAFDKEGELCLTVEDNGAGMPEETLARLNRIPGLSMGELSSLFPDSQGGYGIGNVIARLKLYYQDSYQFRFENLPRGVRCEILLPKRGEEV